ncbi:MAG: hypothetical protein ABF318_07730, partial [Ketobacter sp.]
MKNKLLHRLETIREVQLHQSLTHMKRGLEKESLRVNSNGELAQTRHGFGANAPANARDLEALAPTTVFPNARAVEGRPDDD